jgi:hypothetical protein
MPTTYELIGGTTVSGTSTTSVTFSSIPQTFRDLVVIASIRSSAGSGDNLKVRFNGNSSSIYSTTLLGAGGTTKFSNRTTTGGAHGGYILIPDTNAANHTANTFSSLELYVPNYTTASNKQVGWTQVYENNSSTLNLLQGGAGLSQLESTITSVTIEDYNSVYYMPNSSFYLYGIKNS